jgi:hypothetical protein
MMSATERDLVPIAFDDLAKHSAWPRRLLGLEPFCVRQKSEQEVLREFQNERWGTLLDYARSLDRPTLAEIQRMSSGPSVDTPCYLDGAFYLANQAQMLAAHLDLYAEVLEPHVNGATCLVELGAGFGSKLLALSLRGPFSGMPLAAGEYTESGCALISLLARQLNKAVNVGRCDFRTLTAGGLEVPEGAVIFTSYAAQYVPEMSRDFVGFLCRFKPKAVVHFEPCYEYYDEQSLHGLMCRRYIELNDYTRNFVTIVEAARLEGRIAVHACKNVMGNNPLLPISIIEWTPTSR